MPYSAWITGVHTPAPTQIGVGGATVGLVVAVADGSPTWMGLAIAAIAALVPLSNNLRVIVLAWLSTRKSEAVASNVKLKLANERLDRANRLHERSTRLLRAEVDRLTHRYEDTIDLPAPLTKVAPCENSPPTS